MKLIFAIFCAWIHCPVLGVAAIAAAHAQGWERPLSLVIFVISTFAGLIPVKREVGLAVLLGFSIGWWQAFAAMGVIVPILAFVEWRGKAMMFRRAGRPTTSQR